MAAIAQFMCVSPPKLWASRTLTLAVTVFPTVATAASTELSAQSVELAIVIRKCFSVFERHLVNVDDADRSHFWSRTAILMR